MSCTLILVVSGSTEIDFPDDFIGGLVTPGVFTNVFHVGAVRVEGPTPSAGWLEVWPEDPYLADDYEDDELDRIHARVEAPRFFAVNAGAGGGAWFTRLLMRLDPAKVALVDNDHGIIAGVAAMQRLAAQDPRWFCREAMPEAIGDPD